MSLTRNKYDLIRRPLVTEKSTLLKEDDKYIFVVASYADKHSIKDAVEKIFEVKIKKVNILNQSGKRKIFKGRKGVRSAFKKAVVTLAKGYDIDISAGGVK